MQYRLRSLKIEITDRCGLSCSHCSSNASPHCSNEIPFPVICEILRDATKIGLKDVAFSGGEPLLHKDLIKIVGYAKDRKIKVTLYTTGIIDQFPAVVRKLREAGIDRMIFSLHNDLPCEHDRITGLSGSFEKTCACIQTTVNAEIATELHFVPLANNYTRLGRVVEIGRKLGAVRLSVLRFVPHGRGQFLREQVLTNRQNIELRNSILHIRNEFPEFIRTGSPYNFFMLNSQPECMAGIDRLTILPDLRIVPCDAFKRISSTQFAGSEEFSSLATSKLMVCWEKSVYLRKIREYRDYSPPVECSHCTSFSLCRSGCLAQRFIDNDDFLSSCDPGCLKNFV
ncbi:MAG: radical SAM protein [bacterium]